MGSNLKLYYFTNSYPFGIGETWKFNELNILKNYFNEIIVVPYHYAGNFQSPKALPKGVNCHTPLFKGDGIKLSWTSFFLLFDKNVIYFFNEAINNKVFTNKKKIISWLAASIHLKNLLAHPLIKNIISNPSKDIYLNFFWGRGSCDFLPFVKKDNYGKIAVHFHRYDLFEDENYGYIPYRRQLLNSIHLAAPSSEIGLRHMRFLHKDTRCQIELFRLGVVNNGEVQSSNDNILRIVSCSYLSSVKRVHLISEALACVSFPIEWIHIGDGPLLFQLQESIVKLPNNIKVELLGMMDPNELIPFYKQRKIDLFLNVSSSEGVAMTILEALSLGIPTFATNAGGSSEVIDDMVGRIFDINFVPQQLAIYLEEFYKMPVEKKSQMRQRAKRKFYEMADIELTTFTFVKEFLSHKNDLHANRK